jgi:O-antigen ligase/uncharacterized protein YueI
MSGKTIKAENSTSIDSSNNNYFEIITMLFILSILLIDFFPQFRSIEIIAPQYLYLSFVNIIASLFIFKNPAVLSSGLRSIFEKSWVFKSYFLFVFLCVLSTLMANNFSIALISLVQITTIFCTFINLTLLLHNRKHLIYNICFVVGLSVFIQSYLAINSLFTLVKSSTLSNAFGLLKGNTGNINIFAASLTGKLPFLLLGIFHFKKWKQWFLSFTLLLSTIIIFLIASRASYIALFLNFLCFSAFLFFFKSNNKQYKSALPYVLIPLVIGFFIATFAFKQSEDKGRFVSITERVSQINPLNSQDASINIRFKYWENAIKIAGENPVFGVGLGNWKIESQPYEKEISNNLTLSDHPHNDFLEIAAESGFLNLLVYLSIFIFALVLNGRILYSSNDSQTKLIALVTLLLMSSYGIDAFFNFPLYRTTMQINFSLFLALTISNRTSILTSIKGHNKLILVLTFISGITLYISYQTFKAYQFENDTTFDLQLAQPTYRYDKIIDKIPTFPNIATNSQPYIEVAAIYAFKELKFDKALNYFNQSAKINPYTGRAEWYKYRIYKEKGISDSASYYAHKAFEIRPRNQDYFLSALVVDANAKDTTGIMQTHETYTKYSKEPSNWINTSSALAQSLYPNDKILSFIDTGLALFPKDTTLLNRKKSFLKDAQLAQSNRVKQFDNSKTNNIALANQFAMNLKFDKALVYFKKAAKEDPNNIIVTQNIGICYFQTKQFKSAINYLEKTLNSPLLIDGKTEFILGVAYLNTNNKEKGCKYLILAENKNYPGAAKLVTQYCK